MHLHITLLTAALAALSPSAPARADQILGQPRIDGSRRIILPGGPTGGIGTWDGTTYAITPDTLQMKGPITCAAGSTCDASAVSVIPSPAAPAGTLAAAIFERVVPCNGANVTAAVAAALALGPTRIGPGSCTLDNLSLSGNPILRGSGRDLTVVKRPAGSGSNVMMVGNGVASLTLSDLTLDGDRANQTVPGINLIYQSSGRLAVTNVRFKGAKKVGGYGQGIAIVTSTDAANSTASVLDGVDASDNDADGISADRTANLTIRRFSSNRNGGQGISAGSLVFPPSGTVGANDNLVIENGAAFDNGGTGVQVAGYIAGGSAARPVWGVEYPSTRHFRMSGVTVGRNKAYGITAQGQDGVVTSNVSFGNGTDGIGGGGILAHGEKLSVKGNVITDNYNFGIDHGGCVSCDLGPNTLRNNRVEIIVGGTVGSTLDVGNIETAGSAVNAIATESAGSDTGPTESNFEYLSGNLTIKGGTIKLTSPSAVGVNLADGVDTLAISGVKVYGGSVGNAFWLRGGNDQSSNNMTVTASDNVSWTDGGQCPAVAIGSGGSAGTLSIPDVGDCFYVTNSGTLTTIKSQSEFRFADKVRWITGSTPVKGAYDPANPPALTISGGGCTTAPTALARISNAGAFMGGKMVSTGGGCTSTPTVTIAAPASGFTGGATARAQFGLVNTQNREISLIFFAFATLTQGAGNLLLNGGSAFTAASSCTIRLRGYFGNWREVSRSC